MTTTRDYQYLFRYLCLTTITRIVYRTDGEQLH